MKNWWLRFGCFMTGYRYDLVKVCSEASAKSVKKYLSAMLIVSILWAFIGFLFAERYLKADLIGCIAAAVILVIIVIQIERQIILGVHRNKTVAGFRVVIALVMSLLGSVIIDQIIFAEDVEKENISLVAQEVNEILPTKSKEIRDQIEELKVQIDEKENEREELIAEITANPTIDLPSSTSSTVAIKKSIPVKDKLGNVTQKDTIVKERQYSYTKNSIPNPKVDLIPDIDAQINNLIVMRTQKEDQLVTLRADIEAELKSKTGFLDELEVLFSLIQKSTIALVVWILWLVFLLGIELFVLFSKYGDQDNDYDETIKHQMDMSIDKLRQLTNPQRA